MKSRILLAFLTLWFLSACNGTLQVGIEHAPVSSNSTATTQPMIELPNPTATPTPPSPTVILPSPIVAQPTETQVPPVASPTPQMVQIFLIALEDNGQTGKQVGCGDSVIPVQVEIPPTQGVLKAALESLLSVKAQYYGESGLYNALYQSNLQVENVKIENGKATVNLVGTLQMGGECDSPRVQAQLEETVLQFPTVNEVSIFINGKPLSEVLSLKG